MMSGRKEIKYMEEEIEEIEKPDYVEIELLDENGQPVKVKVMFAMNDANIKKTFLYILEDDDEEDTVSCYLIDLDDDGNYVDGKIYPLDTDDEKLTALAEEYLEKFNDGEYDDEDEEEEEEEA